MKHFLVTFFCLSLLINFVSGQIPEVPTNYITDIADHINADQEVILNDTLNAFEARTTHQIFVLISDTIGDRNIDELGPELAEKWGVGQAGKDNGILVSLFVKDRQLRIDVGYGLEADLTDYQTALIRENIMNPLLRQEQYAAAVEAGVFEIMRLLKSVEIAPIPSNRYSISHEKIGYPPVIWWSDNTLNIHFLLLLVFLILEAFGCFKLWGQIVNQHRKHLLTKKSRNIMLWGSHAVVFICISIVALLNSDLYYSIYIVGINNVEFWLFIGALAFWGMIPLAMWLYKWKKVCEINEVKASEKTKEELAAIEEWGILEFISSFLAHIFLGLIIWLNYGLLLIWIVGEVDVELGVLIGTIVASVGGSLTFYSFYQFFLYGKGFGNGGSSFSSSGRSSFGSSTFSSGSSSSWGGGSFGGGGGGSFGGGGSSGSW